MEIFTKMLNTKVLHQAIINDGDCFFHALEYALGYCPLVPEQAQELSAEEKYEYIKRDIYRNTRTQVSERLLQDQFELLQDQFELLEPQNALLNKYKKKSKRIKDKLESVNGNNKVLVNGIEEINRLGKLIKEISKRIEEISKRIEEINKRIEEIQNFSTSQEYADEPIIHETAVYKKKILFIVQQSDDPIVSMIHPIGVPMTQENVIVLLRSSTQQHYNTFIQPLEINDDFLEMLSNFEAATNSIVLEEGLNIKDATLEDVLSYYNPNKLKKIKYAVQIEKQIASNENFARRLQNRPQSISNSYKNIRRTIRPIKPTPRIKPSTQNPSTNSLKSSLKNSNTFINPKRLQREAARRKTQKIEESTSIPSPTQSPRPSPKPSPKPSPRHTRKWTNPFKWAYQRIRGKKTKRIPRTSSLNRNPQF